MTQILSYWPWMVGMIAFVVSVWASAHVILYKRDYRAAIGWTGLIWLVPLGGGLLYFLFGINRIRRRAMKLRRHRPHLRRAEKSPAHVGADPPKRPHWPTGHLQRLSRLVGHVTGHPLLRGNQIEPLQNGEQAYPAMLQAIAEAQQSVTLGTYIFDNDTVGMRFLEALRAAVARGVEVRVLIDDIGAHYSRPSIFGPLRRAGVRTAAFLPRLIPASLPYANLRNHRKTLVVDGRIGFTGGMNIRAAHECKQPSRCPTMDLHFRIEGPVVGQLQAIFADDWHFSTTEILAGDHWFPALEARGTVLARGVSGGPDDNFDKLRMTYFGALTCARRTIQIVTPYFLPDFELVAALNSAALRGVQVDILLPEKNNLRFVQWATMAMLWQVLEHGCRVWLTPLPFDHTKLILIDGVWSMFGSANWDPRSLRLNFEFNVECYDRELAASLDAIVGRKREIARMITLADLDARPLSHKLRDGLVRLFSAYL